ncbi:MAG TPA: hypothetical protein VI997_04615, partial [Candidatus Thermoplasmatota archaeon]|nr:hypothetical protein [Candidatus Thermoplasmatota archaeon]
MPPVGYLVNVAGGVLVAALGIVVGRLRPRGAANVTFGLWAFAFGGGFALSNVPYLAGQSPEEYYARGGLAYVAGALVVMLLAAASILFVRLGLIVPGPLPKGSRRILVLPLAVLAADVVVTTASAADKGPALAVAAAAWGAAMGSLWAVLVLLALRFDAEPGPGGRARIQIGLVSAATLVWIGLISGALARATPSDPPESAIVVAAGRVGLAAALLVSGL